LTSKPEFPQDYTPLGLGARFFTEGDRVFVKIVDIHRAAEIAGVSPAAGGTSLLSPQKAVFDYALEFVIGGFVAGVVAGEIRKQVEAAMREAEKRLQVDRMEHDLEVARSIQQSLLPSSMPQVTGYEIAPWNQPADQTGGDYYDWQLLPDGRVVLALADVKESVPPCSRLSVEPTPGPASRQGTAC
jgi:hypothetical protein